MLLETFLLQPEDAKLDKSFYKPRETPTMSETLLSSILKVVPLVILQQPSRRRRLGELAQFEVLQGEKPLKFHSSSRRLHSRRKIKEKYARRKAKQLRDVNHDGGGNRRSFIRKALCIHFPFVSIHISTSIIVAHALTMTKGKRFLP
jgi:hypothetical protein